MLDIALSRRQFIKLTAGLAMTCLIKPAAAVSSEIIWESRAIFDESLKWVTRKSANILLSRIKEAGFNVFIPCIWHGRGTVWPSKLAPWDPFNERVPLYDPLENLIKEAEKFEVEIHPWFTVSLRQRDFLAKFYDPGTPEERFDIHNEDFREFISALILEVVSQYPVQGINLDYIRAGGICKSAHCIKEYKKRTGRNLLMDWNLSKIPGVEFDDLANWQEEAVGDIVRRVSISSRKINPNIVISVDAVPGYKSYELEGQNSPKWADEGLVDVIYWMAYGDPPDFDHIKQIQSKMKRPEAIVVLSSNCCENGAEGKINPRKAVNVNEILKESRKIQRGNGVGLYLYSMLSDDQIHLIHGDVFKDSAKPLWVRSFNRQSELSHLNDNGIRRA